MTRAAAALPLGLERRLGLWSACVIVLGATIGSGIFRMPALVAERVPDPLLMLGVWGIGGLLTLAGALSFAELSAALPHAGGAYVFLREAWGRPLAFLFAWARLVLIASALAGAVATVFSEYLLRAAGLDPDASPGLTAGLAAGAVGFATLVNIAGVRLGAAVIGVSTVAKYAGLALVVAAAFALGGPHGASAQHFGDAGSGVRPGEFGLALVAVLWAYGGFIELSFAAGEVKNPARTLPRALAIATGLIIAIYVLTNAAYLFVMPVSRLAASELIAADTMRVVLGSRGDTLVSLLVAIATFSTLNTSLLSGPRVLFAMARDGLFFAPFARVHPRFGTPHVAVAMTGALGIVMALTQSFEHLAGTFILASWPFYALSAAALYRLRWARPDLARPFRVPGYPVVPAIFIAGALYLVLNAAITEPRWTAVVAGVVGLGLPVYYAGFASRARGSAAATPADA